MREQDCLNSASECWLQLYSHLDRQEPRMVVL
ncbi:rCG60121 [Rattus norvegicus]|uniref:RCG60121 n=1 Tax=Rattus norvegicus TaxID=10116 RepID=A6HQP8_RAT|nr:rCG60121 [Rattus norvegicus]